MDNKKDFKEEELAVEEVTEKKVEPAKKAEPKKTKSKPKEKMVSIFIPHIDGEPDQEFYSVNERTWLVRKGEQIDVPECLAENIMNSNRQVKAASDARNSMKENEKEIASL